jgi:hypothetical protein
MVQSARTIVGVGFDILRLVASFLRPSSVIRAVSPSGMVETPRLQAKQSFAKSTKVGELDVRA